LSNVTYPLYRGRISVFDTVDKSLITPGNLVCISSYITAYPFPFTYSSYIYLTHSASYSFTFKSQFTYSYSVGALVGTSLYLYQLYSLETRPEFIISYYCIISHFT